MVDKLISSLGEAECALARYVYETIIKDIAHYVQSASPRQKISCSSSILNPQSASLRSLDWGYE